MAVPITPCCTAVLNQQQAEVIYHHNQCDAPGMISSLGKTKMKTVVENGRVVVKPISSASVEEK